MEKGHEELDIVDPSELDDEAFLKERDKLLSRPETDDTEDQAGESLDDKDAGDTGQEPPKDEEDAEGVGETPDNPTGDTDEEKPKDEEKEDGEAKPFSLEDEKPKGKEKIFLDIIYNGQTEKLTKEEAIRRAQMGTDYETKMRQLAPHRRLIEIVNRDKGLQDLITTYIQNGGKLPDAKPEQPRLKPLTEYDGEDAAERWLMDGIKTIQANEKANVQPVKDVSQKEMSTALQVRAILSLNDSENFDDVFPEMCRRLPTLTQADQAKIDAQCAQGDFRGIHKFYTYVRDNIVKPKAKAEPTETPKQKTDGADKFRMRPGGGTPPKESSADGGDLPDPWQLSDKDFKTHMRRLKGHV